MREIQKMRGISEERSRRSDFIRGFSRRLSGFAYDVKMIGLRSVNCCVFSAPPRNFDAELVSSKVRSWRLRNAIFGGVSEGYIRIFVRAWPGNCFIERIAARTSRS